MGLTYLTPVNPLLSQSFIVFCNQTHLCIVFGKKILIGLDSHKNSIVLLRCAICDCCVGT